MCGRLSLHHLDAVYTLMDLLRIPPARIHMDGIEPHYNVAPTLQLPVLVERGDQLSLFPMTWGVLPGWAVRKGSQQRLVNARSETAWELPTFRESMRQRRCVIIANGFFEWQRDANDKPLMPFYFHPGKTDWLAMAGIYQASVTDGTPECCVLTTTPNALMTPVHDRMPCVLDVQKITGWLQSDSDALARGCLQSAEEDALVKVRVSHRVNSVKNDDAGIILADAGSPEQGRLF